MIIKIINWFLVLLALSSGSVLGSIFNKRFEETFPVTIMGVILILYINLLNLKEKKE